MCLRENLTPYLMRDDGMPLGWPNDSPSPTAP